MCSLCITSITNINASSLAGTCSGDTGMFQGGGFCVAIGKRRGKKFFGSVGVSFS